MIKDLLRRAWLRLFPAPEPAMSTKQPKKKKSLPPPDKLDDFDVVTEELRALKVSTLQKPSGGPRVLFATGLGAYNHGSVLDSVLAIATTMRGAQASLMLCDSFLPICQIIKQTNSPIEVLKERKSSSRCASCFQRGNALMQETGLPVFRYSQFLSESERQQIFSEVDSLKESELATYSPEGMPVGEHALAGALRYYARGDLSGEPGAEIVLRRSLEAALMTVRAFNNYLDKYPTDVVVAHHGIYVPQGLLVAVCKQRKIRAVTWNPAYRKHCFIFSHADSYHHTMISEPVETWRNVEWSQRLSNDLGKYLKSRWYGTEDWIWFHSEPQHDIEKIRSQVGWDASRPVITLLSNVIWDAQLHYASNAFPSMIDWVLETIEYFKGRTDVQLVIRVHPAEIRGFVPSRQPLVEEIRKAYPQLPGNVFVVGPESDVSTYALCDASNAVLIYNTKTGMEVTAKGIPTIVAGEAWIRNKGFAKDPTTRAGYFSELAQLPYPSRMSRAETELAQKYGYHVFFRRMIPLPFLQPLGKTSLSLKLESLDGLRPGCSPGLDVICSGILEGTPFTYKAESISESSPPLVTPRIGNAESSASF
jgi:hypothetical protein